jgi:hypothetical protein
VYDVRKKMLDLILSGCHNIGATENVTRFDECGQESSQEVRNNPCQTKFHSGR